MNLGDRITVCRKSRNLSQMELASACGWDNQGRVNNYEKNRREPTLKDIETIAKALWASPEWMAYGIGAPPEYLAYTVIPEGKGATIRWDLVKEWHESLFDIKSLIKNHPDILQPFRTGQSRVGDSLNQPEYITVPQKNRNQYGLRIKDDSMVSPAPGSRSFAKDEIIIVEPTTNKVPPLSFVLVLQNDSSEVLFKQYILDGNKEYLRPLNPQYPLIPYDETAMKICAIVIECRDILVDPSRVVA